MSESTGVHGCDYILYNLQYVSSSQYVLAIRLQHIQHTNQLLLKIATMKRSNWLHFHVYITEQNGWQIHCQRYKSNLLA